MVVCRNMNATDVERLVPHLGCQPDEASRNSTSRTRHKGRCIELLQPHLGSTNSRPSSQTSSSGLSKEVATACRGEADLCHDLNGASGGCEENDVICQLMHKVRNYLRTHYNEERPPRPPQLTASEAVEPANRPQRRKVMMNSSAYIA